MGFRRCLCISVQDKTLRAAIRADLVRSLRCLRPFEIDSLNSFPLGRGRRAGACRGGGIESPRGQINRHVLIQPHAYKRPCQQNRLLAFGDDERRHACGHAHGNARTQAGHRGARCGRGKHGKLFFT